MPDAVGVDQPRPYTRVGECAVHLKGDARQLYWFNDESLDYVFSSHLLEDFSDTEIVLREWLRVLKIGGHLVLYLPNEQIYRRHCQTTGQPYNAAHTIADMSLEYIQSILDRIGVTNTVHANPSVEAYSFEIVAQKTESCPQSALYQTSYYRLVKEQEATIAAIKRSPTFRLGKAIMDAARIFRLDVLLRRGPHKGAR